MALQFSRLGCILVCWDINEAAAAKTAQEVQEAGGKGYSFCCDVSSQIEVEKAAAKVKATVPQVDIIINNAGIMPCHPFLNHSIQEIDRCIDVNVKGCLWVSAAQILQPGNVHTQVPLDSPFIGVPRIPARDDCT